MSWKKLKSQTIFESPFFSLKVDECQTATGLIVPKYYVVDFVDWVQAVALDTDKNLVLVRQYRYAGDGEFLEFAGGSLDPHKNEDPLHAAQRELKEETGYESSDWIYLGAHYPNPALQSNRTHSFLARNCVKTSGLNLDPFEDITVEVHSIDDFVRASRAPGRHHSMMLATLFLAQAYF